jgi:galactose mutarotase-like enzyme
MNPFSRREEQRGDRLLDVLTDEKRGLQIIVSRLGAELIRVARRDQSGAWIGFLHRDNDIAAAATGWANHATVMGYFLHRLKNERSLYRGREIRGGTHSFLRTKLWHRGGAAGAVPAENELTYRITPEDFSSTEYPLKVSLDLRYTLESGRIAVSFRFRNEEPGLTAHVGFGLHPGFAAASFESFQFEMPAGLYRRHFSPGNYLTGEIEDLQFGGGPMPFEREKLPGSYILELVNVPERRFTFSDPPSGRSVVMDLPRVPYLTLWSDGGPFLCVEPCWGLTDRHDQRAFEDKDGIQKIPAGQELIASFSFEPRLTA